MTAEVSAAVVVARDVVQTFDAALQLLDDTDLMPIPGSPSLEPPISGSKSPPSPYHGDQGLRGYVMDALRQCHDAAVILCQLDQCDDPLPWEEAPTVNRTALPSLAEMHRHVQHLDLALADVQRHIHGMAPQDREIALHACAALDDPPGIKPYDRGITHRRWDHMARRARMQCQRCWRLSGRAVLCQECSTESGECRNPDQREQCLKVIHERGNAKRRLCRSCDQARRNQQRVA